MQSPPPTYRDVVNGTPTTTFAPTAAADRDNTGVDDRDSEVENESVDNDDQIQAALRVILNTIDYLQHPSQFEGIENASNGFKGFIDILYELKMSPHSFSKKIICKVALLIYYFTNFIYSIVAVSVQAEHFAYYLFYLFISLTGLIFEIIVLTADVKERMHPDAPVQPEEIQPREAWPADNEMSQTSYSHKAMCVLKDYVLLSLGEILIYPILICCLYGLINEKGWEFNNGISGCNFLFFLYSIAMDVLFIKSHGVLSVMRTLRAAYTQYDELIQPREIPEWQRYFTPVYLTIPFAVVTAVTQWLMIGIIGVRVYVDNFTPNRDDTDIVPNTGKYKVSAFAGYMIGCCLCLPIFSSAAYILLNKLWFYEVFSLIHHSRIIRRANLTTESRLVWNFKLFAFIRDPLAYFTVSILITLFIIFTVGTYLPDYNSSDFDVAPSARNAVDGLGACFIIFFIFSNIQAVIIFTVAVILITTMALGILCIVVGCLCSDNNSEPNTHR